MKRNIKGIVVLAVAIVALASFFFTSEVLSQGQSANYLAMQTVMENASKCTALVQQYEAGTILLADGETEVTLTGPQINTLKQAFVTLKLEGIAAWNSVTAE